MVLFKSVIMYNGIHFLRAISNLQGKNLWNPQRKNAIWAVAARPMGLVGLSPTNDS